MVGMYPFMNDTVLEISTPIQSNIHLTELVKKNYKCIMFPIKPLLTFSNKDAQQQKWTNTLDDTKYLKISFLIWIFFLNVEKKHSFSLNHWVCLKFVQLLFLWMLCFYQFTPEHLVETNIRTEDF